MIYAVIDTNVLVSAALAKTRQISVPYMILQEIWKGSFVPLVDESILKEYNDVLYRSKFNVSHDHVAKIIGIINDKALNVSVPKTNKVLPDMDDVIFYDVAYGNRDKGAYLVTGNMKHFPDCDFVLTPRAFLNMVNPIIPGVVNDNEAIYDPMGLMASLRALNDEAQKNGTAGMSEEEIEAEIKLMHEERRQRMNKR